MKTYGKAIFKYGTPACFGWAIVENLKVAPGANKQEITDEEDEIVAVIFSQHKTQLTGDVTLLAAATGGPMETPGSEWPTGGWLTVKIAENHTIDIIIESAELTFAKAAAATYSFTGYAYPKIKKGE